jgi:hypothetical protein
MLGKLVVKAAGITTKLNDCDVADTPVASVTCRLKVEQPGVTSVPTIGAAEVFVPKAMERPFGSEPEATVQVYGATPPDERALRDAEDRVWPTTRVPGEKGRMTEPAAGHLVAVGDEVPVICGGGSTNTGKAAELEPAVATTVTWASAVTLRGAV